MAIDDGEPGSQGKDGGDGDEHRDGARGSGLDPQDWPAFRAQAHRMLDDIIDYVARIREAPVWRHMPDDARRSLAEPLPREGQRLDDVHAQFKQAILPFATGNVHPGFMGWVHGGGTVYGMAAEMLAAGLDSNLGGRDHAPIQVERQVIRWFSDLLGLPATASGVLVTGTSIANFMAVVIARAAALGAEVRRAGIGGRRLVAYTSSAVHGCVPRAMDMAGLGTDALRIVATNAGHQIDVAALRDAVARDRTPGINRSWSSAPPVPSTSAPSTTLPGWGRFAASKACGFTSTARSARWARSRRRFARCWRASKARTRSPLDFSQVGPESPTTRAACWCATKRPPCVPSRPRQPTCGASRAAWRPGGPGPAISGPDLSRGFRALKVWYTFKVLGADRIAASIEQTCALAQRARGSRSIASPSCERLAPVALNIVCFRYRFADHLDRENAALAADLQESGIAAPSTTTIGGSLALRAAIVNHRTRASDVDGLVDATLAFGRRRNAELRGATR